MISRNELKKIVLGDQGAAQFYTVSRILPLGKYELEGSSGRKIIINAVDSYVVGDTLLVRNNIVIGKSKRSPKHKIVRV